MSRTVRAVLQAGANGYVLKTADAEDICRSGPLRSAKEVGPGPGHRRGKVMRRFSGEGPLPLEALTEREPEVLRLAAHGYTNKAIGVQLDQRPDRPGPSGEDLRQAPRRQPDGGGHAGRHPGPDPACAGNRRRQLNRG